jgi:tetratricopeptide (TPR) repeat protein
MKKIALLIVCLGFIPAVFWATPEPPPSENEKEEVELLAPDLLKREQEGESLTAEMHFALGTDAYKKGDKEEAARHWGIAALLGGSPHAYNNWGIALSELAKMKGDEALFRESLGKFAEAVRIKPDDHAAYYNWGKVLRLCTEIVKGKTEREALFRESFIKYEKAVRIKPDKYKAYYNWGIALSELAKIKGDEALYRKAFTKYEKVVDIKPD